MSIATPSSPGSEPPRAKHDEDAPTETNKKTYGCCEDRISTLPKTKGWFNKGLWQYEGFYFWSSSLPGLMRMQAHFNARSSDVLITSFPKAGTTWVKALVFAIVNRSRYEKETNPFLTKTPHDCIQNLELYVYRDSGPTLPLDDIPPPRLFGTHVPYTSLPKSVINSKCKIIYIYRDPKDVLISLYHFASKITPQISMNEDDGNLEMDNFSIIDAYVLFCKGISPYGPYWDNVLSYWKASIERSQNILFLRYEDLQGDPQFYVKRLAQFLGQPFSLQEEETGEIQRIVDLCSFESLSGLQINKTGTHVWNFSNTVFFRKGEVGDWKNYLTIGMAEHLDQIIKQKLDGSGLTL